MLALNETRLPVSGASSRWLITDECTATFDERVTAFELCLSETARSAASVLIHSLGKFGSQVVTRSASRGPLRGVFCSRSGLL